MESAEAFRAPAIQRAHSGGFFWTVTRSRRLQLILDLAARLSKLVVIAGSESEAADVAERLTLRGLPVQLAAAIDARPRVAAGAEDSGVVVITTAEYAAKNGPVEASMTLHLRPPFSARSYIKRLKCVVSPVHITFVTPEDQARAEELRNALSPQATSEAPNIDLSTLIDLTTSDAPAEVDSPRRRFAFRQGHTKQPLNVPVTATP